MPGGRRTRVRTSPWVNGRISIVRASPLFGSRAAAPVFVAIPTLDRGGEHAAPRPMIRRTVFGASRRASPFEKWCTSWGPIAETRDLPNAGRMWPAGLTRSPRASSARGPPTSRGTRRRPRGAGRRLPGVAEPARRSLMWPRIVVAPRGRRALVVSAIGRGRPRRGLVRGHRGHAEGVGRRLRRRALPARAPPA